jgi:hypothetical protein
LEEQSNEEMLPYLSEQYWPFRTKLLRLFFCKGLIIFSASNFANAFLSVESIINCKEHARITRIRTPLCLAKNQIHILSYDVVDAGDVDNEDCDAEDQDVDDDEDQDEDENEGENETSGGKDVSGSDKEVRKRKNVDRLTTDPELHAKSGSSKKRYLSKSPSVRSEVASNEIKFIYVEVPDVPEIYLFIYENFIHFLGNSQ